MHMQNLKFSKSFNIQLKSILFSYFRCSQIKGTCDSAIGSVLVVTCDR